MPALFSPASDTILRASLAAGLAALIGVPLFLMAWVRAPINLDENEPLEQPIEFDHRHHVADDGLDCRYCHSSAERSAYAGIPASSLCMNCHGQIWSSAPLLEPLRQSYYLDKPLEWQRVYRLPDFVFFNHSIHLERGVGCVTCHGRIDRMARVYRVTPLTMGWCLDCHRAPEQYLRPLDKVTDLAWVPDRPQLEIGRALVAELAVRPPENCSACHR